MLKFKLVKRVNFYDIIPYDGGTVCMASELLSNLLCHEEGVGDDICAEGGDSLYTGNQGGGGILVTIFWTKSASNCEVYSSYNHMSSINQISVDP